MEFRPRHLVIAGVLIALGVPSVWLWRVSQDLPEPGDADLLLSRAPLSPTQNTYDGLRQVLVGAKRVDPEWTPLEWRPAKMASAEGRAVYDGIAEALGRPAFQFPVPGSDDPVVLELTGLAQLLDARALALAESGDVEAAFSDALQIVRLGERVATGEGVTLVAAMIGGRVQELGYARVRSLLESHGVTALGLKRWLRRLGDRPIPVEARARVWAGEYLAFKTHFSRGMQEQRQGAPFWRGSPNGYFYQHNRTLAKIAESFRRYRETAGGCGGGPERAVPEMNAVDYLRPNAVGEILSRVASPEYRRYQEHFCALEVRRLGTRSVLALRAYRLDHGDYPDRLQALVPGYLAAVPTDPFDGLRLRYSRADRRVWSVGRDRVDAGGEPSNREGDALDEIALPLEIRPKVVADSVGRR